MLSTLKPVYASWILELYNYLTSKSGKEIIANGLKAAGISDAIKTFLPLEPLNLFSSIDTLDQPIEGNIFYHQTTYPNAEFIEANYDSDNEDEWITEDSFEERNISEISNDEMLY